MKSSLSILVIISWLVCLNLGFKLPKKQNFEEYGNKTEKAQNILLSNTESKNTVKKNEIENEMIREETSFENKKLPAKNTVSGQTLSKSEIESDSQASIDGCVGAKDQEEHIECVIDNLSLKFFFTAFSYYKKRFNKSYGTVAEELKRFNIFIHNYKIILR